MLISKVVIYGSNFGKLNMIILQILSQISNHFKLLHYLSFTHSNIFTRDQPASSGDCIASDVYLESANAIMDVADIVHQYITELVLFWTSGFCCREKNIHCVIVNSCNVSLVYLNSDGLLFITTLCFAFVCRNICVIHSFQICVR